jgi:hypothetical protein
VNVRFQHILKCASAVLVVAGSVLATATPSRADFKLTIWDFRANLKVKSSLGEPFFHAPSGNVVRALSFTIQNDGFLAAPASTTAVIIEAGDPFSPISTAIALQNYATPALAGGATAPGQIILIPETVYIKVDIRADAGNVVNERTSHDNHRVHSVGYVP